jgi:hypothetical protein
MRTTTSTLDLLMLALGLVIFGTVLRAVGTCCSASSARAASSRRFGATPRGPPDKHRAFGVRTEPSACRLPGLTHRDNKLLDQAKLIVVAAAIVSQYLMRPSGRKYRSTRRVGPFSTCLFVSILTVTSSGKTLSSPANCAVKRTLRPRDCDDAPGHAHQPFNSNPGGCANAT